MDDSYIAGFFDGEGSLMYTDDRYRITIPNTNKEVLDRILEHVGYGFVWEVATRKAHWKQSWVYATSDTENTLKFLERIAPYLIVKKENCKNLMPGLRAKVREMKQTEEKRQDKNESIMKYHRLGWSTRKIAREVGCSHSNVAIVIQKARLV
jgi:hypothetical protein